MASPLTALPILHSLETAKAKLFLDFDGDPGLSNWLGIFVPPVPAYDKDNAPTTYNSTELKNIEEIWKRVAEKYSPFNIDVTTQDPGNRNDQTVSQIIIGGSFNDWLFAPAGGVAPIGGFFNSSPNTGFVFSEDGVDTNKQVAEAAAHEAGHTFGLLHHSIYDGDVLKEEYDPGDTQSAPIMGVGYYSARSLWAFAADDTGPFNFQDDLAILSGLANGFGFRPDEVGDTQFEAKLLNGVNGTVSATGVLSTSTDVDVFSFTSPPGTVRFSVTPPAYGNMLDASIELRNAFGQVLRSSKTSSWSEEITTNISTAGTYYVYVTSAGGYGDIGQYELSGTLPKGVVINNDTQLLVSGTDGDDIISINLVDGSYALDINGTVNVIDPAVVGQFNVLAGGGNDRVTIGTGVCKTYMLGGEGDDVLIGGDFSDTITASAGNDQIFGGAGDDRLAGSAGRDILIGGTGRDRLYGEKGNDVLKGGTGVDRLYGGDDHDVLSGEASDDKEYGETGNDTIFGGEGSDLLNGGIGLDQIYGNEGNDVLFARDQTVDLLNGGDGRDQAETEDDDTQISLEELLA